ncbi:unnamed protein product [Durusdinium trenchii]|uniref:Uncharacterized protein n=1 Tax=Durusdinium trenchii TaxID=1381693 RepID=A0ABP0RHS2_9DINO
MTMFDAKEAEKNASAKEELHKHHKVVDDVGQTVADIINKSVSGNTTTSSEKVESSATNASASSASDRSTANSSNVSSVADAAEHVGQAVSDIIDKWSAAGNATTSDEKADDIKKTVTDVTEAIKNVSENEVVLRRQSWYDQLWSATAPLRPKMWGVRSPTFSINGRLVEIRHLPRMRPRAIQKSKAMRAWVQICQTLWMTSQTPCLT